MLDLGIPTIVGPVKQVALVVHDLEASVRAWTEQLGVGPWTAFELGPGVLRDMTYLGEPSSFSIRHALAWTDTVQFELVQPLGGQSIHADHLAEHGEGLHHLGVYVEDHAAAVEKVLAAGYKPLQSARGFGATGDGAFAYFGTDHPLAAILEIIEAPAVRREPAFVYPPQESGQESNT